MEIRGNELILEYKDETWGSFRHWQVVESVRKVSSIEEAKAVIESKERDGFKACWELEVVEKDFHDSRKNRHRAAKYKMLLDENKIYLVKRWDKCHPSGNTGRWLSGFIFYIIAKNQLVEIIDKRIQGF